MENCNTKIYKQTLRYVAYEGVKQTILKRSQNQNVKIMQFKSMAMADYIMHNKIRTKCDIHLTLMAEAFIKKHTHL